MSDILAAALAKVKGAPGGSLRAATRHDIQALRALAVIAVVAFHLAPGVVRGGFIGVDVFFVVSGYLVGGHLYRSTLAGGIKYREFFAKRARRIVPLSALVATFTMVCMAVSGRPIDLMLWGPHATTPTYARDGIASVLGISNLWFGVSDQGYLLDSYVSPYTQYWSLGVEEQFYIATPFLLTLLWLATRKSRAMVLLVAALTVVSFDMAIYGASIGDIGPFFNPLTRAWELGAGLLVAMLAHRIPARLTTGRAGTVLIAIAWTSLGAMTVTLSISGRWPSPMTALPVLATALAIGVGASRHSGRLARWGLIRWIGDRSYGIYLWHWPLAFLVLGSDSTARPLRIAAVVTLTMIVAGASYRWVESPLRRLQVGTSTAANRALMICGAIGALAIGIIVAIGAHASTGAASTQLRAAKYEAVPVSAEGQDFATVVPLNLRPSLVAVGQDNPASYADGCNVSATRDDTAPGTCVYGTSGPLVALFGDSHALQWLGALTHGIETGRFRVAIVTADACPPYGGPGAYLHKEGCVAWQPAAVAHIQSLAPDLVLISTATWPQQTYAPSALTEIDTAMEDLAEQLDGTKVAWIADTPLHAFFPTGCALEDVTDITACGTTREDALGSPLTPLIRTSADAHGWEWLDLTDYLCDQTECGIILGDVALYRDDDHISDTFSRELAPVLEPQIVALLGK